MTATGTTSASTDTRPKTVTATMRRAAAERTIAAMVGGGHLTEAEREPSVDSLAAIGERHMDGYQIAKRLDDAYGWDCDLQMAEALDDFARHLDDELKTAEKAWFERVRPQPPFPDGTVVAFGRDGLGTIDGVYAYGPAKYEIKVDGDAQADGPTRRRTIVNFEDVRAIGG